MKDKLNAVKTVLCAVACCRLRRARIFSSGTHLTARALCLRRTMHCASGFLLRRATRKNAAAAAAELQEQVDEMTAQIDELNSRLEQAAQSGADAGAAGPMVYVTPSGSRYHNEGCQYIGKRAVQMPLADAKEAGYTACAKCE